MEIVKLIFGSRSLKALDWHFSAQGHSYLVERLLTLL
jgi:hypothetical protein